MNEPVQHDDVRAAVRDQYGTIAREGGTACAPGCCGTTPNASLALGYTAAELLSIPEGANLGLGCGNPTAIAELVPGQVVLDLGAGAGIDAFLAARKVGATGKVIGVDMTPDMVARSRKNAKEMGFAHVDFRLGEIEHLPVADGTVDVILSNCVINLSPEKSAVFAEAFRVLREGGRLCVSDVVLLKPLPEAIAADVVALTGCVSGAATVGALAAMLHEAGFREVSIDVKPESAAYIRDWIPGSGVEEYVASAVITASKRAAKACCGPTCCP